MQLRLVTVWIAVGLGIVSCGGSDESTTTTEVGGGGGLAGTGGGNPIGGANAGGSALAGGTTGTAGAPAKGGAVGVGGSAANGGAAGSAGAPANGGTAGSAGVPANGGAAGNAGAPASGGAGGSAGSLASGGAGSSGAPTSGGTAGSSGAPTSGGTAGNAGSPANGGTSGGGTCDSPTEYPVPEALADEDGSKLWLRYVPVPIAGRLAEYQAAFTHVVESSGEGALLAAGDELVEGLSGLTGTSVAAATDIQGSGAVVLGTPTSSTIIAGLPLASRLDALGNEGYLVEEAQSGGQNIIAVAAKTNVGVLYGSFALLRHLQTHQCLQGLSLSSSPRIQRRILNHWDNLNGTVERGYAGSSIWDFGTLPGNATSQRFKDYARANASIGINGTVLNNVNADYNVLTSAYLQKVAALADAFRPYGIAVYLSARFSAPDDDPSGPNTGDPNNAAVRSWWAAKADEIYNLIPDFGGFLVKANSEGQPGPQGYGATHADGANMLEEALGTRGIVLWRAFVYSSTEEDRIRQAYSEFHPLDGQFNQNVLVQVKNGPLDFQPREPFSPLFGAMPQTPLALELQITKEYLGQDTHLAYLGPLYQELLQSDTYAKGEGSTVAKVIDGSLHGHAISAISGVSNVGSDTNWTGSHFNQANWYVYGRMAWNPDLSAETVADEWIRQTFSNDPLVVAPVKDMMMKSREALVNYMTPLGLAHQMGTDHHYGPAPWVSNLSTDNWNPAYYNDAKDDGLGFDRSPSGSDAVAQYFDPLKQQLSTPDTTPENLLLFFHHVPWSRPMSSARTLWEELVYRYSLGVDQVGEMRSAWNSDTIAARVDGERYSDISEFLRIQHYEARWWRDASLQYFGSWSKLEIPAGYAQPYKSLADYQSLANSCPSNRDKPRCPALYDYGDPSPAILSH